MHTHTTEPADSQDGGTFADKFYNNFTVLTEGSVITTQIFLSTNHGGRMGLSICPLDRSQIDPVLGQSCFDQPQNKLRR